jgi:two-component system KDP operon response regulator KdpE
MEQEAVIFARDSQALLSRVPQIMPAEFGRDAIRIGDIELDSARRTVRKADRRIHLTPKEFELVRELMSQAGRPIRHSRLLAAVWGSEYGLKFEYLRTYICQLRKKLEDDPKHPEYLLTHSHFGYCFAE